MTSTAPPSLPRWRRLVTALLPTLGFFLLLEIGAQVLTKQRFSPYDTSIGIQGDGRWIADPALHWRNRPHYLEYDHSAQYNALGIRVAPGSLAMPSKQPEDFWVLLLGGSTMAGVGASQSGDWLKISGVSSHPIDHAIDGYLEAMLTRALPDRRVRVWNAAVSAHALAQSAGTYARLAHLDPDWVVSLDGVNDPPTVDEGTSVDQWLAAKWSQHAFNRFPVRQARFAMRRSALIYLLGETAFYRSGLIRNPRDSVRDEETIARWLETPPTLGPDRPKDPARHRAVDAYLETAHTLSRRLDADHRPHLILLQPYLAERQPTRFDDTERALYNYLHARQPPALRLFMRELHERFDDAFAGHPRLASTTALHEAPAPVFVDYCHLTRAANQALATAIGTVITSGGDVDFGTALRDAARAMAPRTSGSASRETS